MLDPVLLDSQVAVAVLSIGAGALGAGLTIAGRFIWNNYKRSAHNEVRLDRYGLTIFGDDRDETRPGLAHQIVELDRKVVGLDTQFDRIEGKIDRLCDHINDQ